MIITALTPQKRRPNRVSVFIDGAFAFGLERTDAERCNLIEGAAINDEQLSRLLDEVVFARARDTALRYLSYKQRTLKEVYKRLREDEYPPAVIKRVLILMVKFRYINDRQYAKDYIEARTRAYYGAYRIKQELKFKGVSADNIAYAFEQAELDETANIVNLIKRGRKSFSVDALRRRGFSNTHINEAFQILKD
jgi:regulatory protein